MNTTIGDSMQMQCPKCNAIINLSPTPNNNIMCGNCHTAGCDIKNIFVCSCCKDNMALMAGTHFGRPTSWYFTKLSNCLKHANTVSHKNAMTLLLTKKQEKNLEDQLQIDHQTQMDDDQLQINQDVEDDCNDGEQVDNTNIKNVTIEHNNLMNDGQMILTSQSTNYSDWLSKMDTDGMETIHSLEDLKKHGFVEQSKSPDFFWYEHAHPGKGAQFLTAQAFSLSVDEITFEEAQFSLIMSSLLVQLTAKQRELLAECMLQAVNSKDPTLSIFKTTRPPTSIIDFNHLYLSSKTAVIPNLPHPIPQTTPDGTHAYVALKDVLANELAKATPFDKFHFSSKVVFGNDDEPTKSTTPAAYDLFMELKEDDESRHFTLFLWITEWRDDFDPNNTKASRNQVWINTFTICPPPNDQTGRNTYFMALSSKGDDHSAVEELFNAEIDLLSKNSHIFYHGGLRKLIHVKLGKLSTCVDRPERCSMFQVGDHNGTYSTFWGHACFVDGQCEQNRLPSCSQCRKKNVKQVLNDGNTTSFNDIVSCNNKKCSSWNVFDESFQFPLPKGYPTTYDNRPGTPQPPQGREISGNKRPADSLINDKSGQKLKSIQLSTTWLKQALQFAHHNMKTQPPDTNNVNKRYWTKGMLQSYLRTCGVNGQLIDAVYLSAKNGDDHPPIPASWENPNALSICHYAPMHMLFLGHIKSDYDMTSKFLTKYVILATFGKQVNLYLRMIQKLRVSKYYGAQPLSTSSWGTGVWVSENYLFWARCIKFFATLPSLHNARLLANNADFSADMKMYQRFVSATHYCISKVMSSKRVVPELETSIKIYLDTMVEFDHWLFNLKDSDDLQNAVQLSNSTTTTANNNTTNRSSRAKGSHNKTKPNFVKSNSLGLMSASHFHTHMGPAQINWDGGYSGERKIQAVKPLLSIKRSNAEWQRITLTKLYQAESINWLLESMCNVLSSSRVTVKKPDRSSEGSIKVYLSLEQLQEAISVCQPITGLLSKDKKVWIPYRPKGRRKGTTRSSIDIVEIVFDDENGTLLHSLCWMSSIEITDNIKMFDTMVELDACVDEYILMLPQLTMDGDNHSFQNNYYCVGHSWTERNKDGDFVNSQIEHEIFASWLHETDEVMRNE